MEKNQNRYPAGAKLAERGTSPPSEAEEGYLCFQRGFQRGNFPFGRAIFLSRKVEAWR